MFPFIKFALDERGAPARLRGGGPCRPAADVEKGKVWAGEHPRRSGFV